MIKLQQIFGIVKETYSDYKIHFATGSENKKAPYNAFLIGEFKEWQEHQSKKNFNRKYILSLIYYDKDVWMFGGIYEVLSFNPTPTEDGSWLYDTKLTDKATEYIGRAFFKFKKEFRASYPTLELEPKVGCSLADIPIAYILEKKVELSDFVGFNNVNIDYKTLQRIVSDSLISWKSALSNVKGIYLIVDVSTGKQYVGSAYGEECIWQRWSSYAENGHGGNINLKKLLEINGEDYRYNFKYSILEVCNANLGSEYIIERETYWKEVLMSRTFGLNLN